MTLVREATNAGIPIAPLKAEQDKLSNALASFSGQQQEQQHHDDLGGADDGDPNENWMAAEGIILGILRGTKETGAQAMDTIRHTSSAVIMSTVEIGGDRYFELVGDICNFSQDGSIERQAQFLAG